MCVYVCKGGGGGNFTPPPPPPPPLFSFYNSEKVKSVTLAFCSIQYDLIKDKFYYWAKFIRGYFRFRISGQSFLKENCHNSRTSQDIEMKLGPVPKRDKRNMATSKKFYDDVMSANCDVIVFFPISGQFAATRKPNSGLMAYKT